MFSVQVTCKISDSGLAFLVSLGRGRSSIAPKAFPAAKIVVAILALGVSFPSSIGRASPAPEIPTEGFEGDRYSSLWTKSPFAIATPEAGATTQDYQLTGLAKFDGIAYASLINKQTQEHFLLTSAKPAQNLSLVSINHGRNGGSAVVLRNGEQITLQEENSSPALSPGLPAMPGQLNPGFIPPGQSNPSVGGVMFPLSGSPPPVRMHRPPIAVPPPAPQ
jgi:hypothetical protein